MTPQEAFVTRLRRRRERWGVELADIAAATRVKLELLEAFERGDLSSWPRGLYARAWVRSYAIHIGVDPFQTVEEFCRLFPTGDRRAQAMMEEIMSLDEASRSYMDRLEKKAVFCRDLWNDANEKVPPGAGALLALIREGLERDFVTEVIELLAISRSPCIFNCVGALAKEGLLPFMQCNLRLP